jgi:hypothetical protein
MSDTCPHETFEANVAVARISDASVWYADLTLRCVECGQKMEFIGFPMGLSPGEPMVDVTGTELRIPFKGHSEEVRRKRLLGEGFGYRISPA